MRNWNWGGAALAFAVGLAACALGAQLGNPLLGVLLFVAAAALVFKLMEPKVVYVAEQDGDDADEDQPEGTVSSR